MYCKNCGKEVDKNSKYCQICGSLQNTNNRIEVPQNNKNKIINICLLIITSVIILSIISLGIWKGYTYGLFYTPSECNKELAQKQLEKLFPKTGMGDSYYYCKYTDKNPYITKFIKDIYDKEGKYSVRPHTKSRMCQYQIKYKRIYTIGPYYVDEKNFINRNKESFICIYMWDNTYLKEVVGCNLVYSDKTTSKTVTEYTDKR